MSPLANPPVAAGTRGGQKLRLLLGLIKAPLSNENSFDPMG
jgi:hypothetical protein